MVETADAMTNPGAWDEAPPAKRNGHKGMLPSTWLNRELKVEYAGADGKANATSGILLDWFPAGPVLNVGGARTVVCWDRIALIELAGD